MAAMWRMMENKKLGLMVQHTARYELEIIRMNDPRFRGRVISDVLQMRPSEIAVGVVYRNEGGQWVPDQPVQDVNTDEGFDEFLQDATLALREMWENRKGIKIDQVHAAQLNDHISSWFWARKTMTAAFPLSQ